MKEKIMAFFETLKISLLKELKITDALSFPLWQIICIGVAAFILIVILISICCNTKKKKAKKLAKREAKQIAKQNKKDEQTANTVLPVTEVTTEPIVEQENTVEKIAANVEQPIIVEETVVEQKAEIKPPVAIVETPVVEQPVVVKETVVEQKAKIQQPDTKKEKQDIKQPIAEAKPIKTISFAITEEVAADKNKALKVVSATPTAPTRKYITKAPSPRPTTKMNVAEAKTKVAATEISVVEKEAPVSTTPAASSVTKGSDGKLTIIKLTDAPIEPIKGKYLIVKDPKNPARPFKFLLKANNGQLLFESEGYKIRPRVRQIETFRKAIVQGSFVFDEDKSGNFRFKLLTADGKLFGIGESYKTLDNSENAAKSVANFAISANYIEDTTLVEITE